MVITPSRTDRAILFGTLLLAVVGVAIAGVAVSDILDPGATDPGEGPTLTNFDPQVVNSSTVDTYQVTIAADNQSEGLSLIRQRPGTAGAVSYRIVMNNSFGDAMDPELVAFAGDGGPFGDSGPKERLAKSVSVDNGDVLVEISDETTGSQSSTRLTAITVEFATEAPLAAGNYTFGVEMEAQQTTSGSSFTVLNETATAEVQVVDAAPAQPGDFTLTDVAAPTNASQDESQLEVTGTVENTQGTALAGPVVYGLAEDADPAFDGSDLLTQSQNLTIGPNGQATVTFFVDLTEADLAIDTGDDIRHGIDVLGDNTVAPLAVTDGPIVHSADGGATVNRTTGLIQTAVDLAADGTADVVTVNPRISPYGESVTVDASDLLVRGNVSSGFRPAVVWADSSDPVFSVTDGTDAVRFANLSVEASNPVNRGLVFGDGTGHAVVDTHIRGTGQGELAEWGIELGGADLAEVRNNVIANASVGVRLNPTTNDTVVLDNQIRDADRNGIALSTGSNNTVGSNTIHRAGVGVSLLSTSTDTLVEFNDIADGERGMRVSGPNQEIRNNTVSNQSTGILFDNDGAGTVADNVVTENTRGIDLQRVSGVLVQGNDVTNSSSQGIRLGGATDIEVLGNTVTNSTDGIAVVESFEVPTNNFVSSNQVTDSAEYGILLAGAVETTVDGNTVQNATLAGIRAEAGPDTAASNNTIRGNSLTGGANEGIWLDDSDDNLLENNNASANGEHGILIEVSSQRNDVRSNEVTDNFEGIRLDSSDQNTITDNQASGNIADGIRLVSSHDNAIADNEATGNGNDGVQLDSSQNNSVTNNTLTANGGRGAILFGSDGNALSVNVASNNDQPGIYLRSGSVDNDVAANTVESNGDYGILLSSASNNTVQNNTASDNGLSGIQVEQNADGNEIRDNVATGNANDGIGLFGDATANTVVGNTASDNGNDGIWLRGESNQNTVSNNVAENNTRSGIYLGGVANFADDNTLVNNTARGNDYGIWIGGSSNNVVSESLVENNTEGIEVFGFSENNTEGIEVFGFSENNTFAGDVSVNNTWEFLVEGQATNTTVANLSIGASTAPGTMLSFTAENVRLRSNTTPPADPADATSIDRYVEAESLATGAFLDLALAYDQQDVTDAGVSESALDLRRHNGTAWVAVPGSAVDTAVDVVTANVTTFSTFGAFAQHPESELDALDIAGDGDAATILGGANESVTVTVTNTGNTSATEFDVNLTIGTAVAETVTTGPLDPGENETVVFANVTGDLAVANYPVTTATETDGLNGTLFVSVDVVGEGNPATDTTGDGLLNDVNGDGVFNIFDIQALFNHLGGSAVQDNGQVFDFHGNDGQVTIFDVQALYNQLDAQ